MPFLYTCQLRNGIECIVLCDTTLFLNISICQSSTEVKKCLNWKKWNAKCCPIAILLTLKILEALHIKRTETILSHQKRTENLPISKYKSRSLGKSPRPGTQVFSLNLNLLETLGSLSQRSVSSITLFVIHDFHFRVDWIASRWETFPIAICTCGYVVSPANSERKISMFLANDIRCTVLIINCSQFFSGTFRFLSFLRKVSNRIYTN